MTKTNNVGAIAITSQNPFKAALASAENFGKLALDFFYGTPKRIEYTMAGMFFLLSVSLALESVSKTILQTCPV